MQEEDADSGGALAHHWTMPKPLDYQTPDKDAPKPPSQVVKWIGIVIGLVIAAVIAFVVLWVWHVRSIGGLGYD